MSRMIHGNFSGQSYVSERLLQRVDIAAHFLDTAFIYAFQVLGATH